MTNKKIKQPVLSVSVLSTAPTKNFNIYEKITIQLQMAVGRDANCISASDILHGIHANLL